MEKPNTNLRSERDGKSRVNADQSVKVSFREKAALEVQHRNQLLDDLLHQRLHFSSQPYEAHVQFSNYCNMSCIMCWDGRNPPVEKATPELLQRIDEQIAPHLSICTPYSGSEPLVLSWDETREMAKRNSILLCLTTNAQYLDETRFHELREITETLILSIDSHIPEVFLKIRPGANVEKVFQNLETTARLCAEHRLECIVNIVLMTHNAPHLVDTIEYLGKLGIETVNVIQLLDVNGRSRYIDPLLHFSHEYIDWIRQSCIDMVRTLKMRLIWSVAGCFEFDFRGPDHVRPLERKSWNDAFDERMKRLFPGFCRNVFNRLRIDGDGDVAPCCYATQGELSFGNINDQDFAEIWNGPSARDLRRGMLTGDVPAHCSACRYVDPIGPQVQMPFAIACDESIQQQAGEEVSIRESLSRVDPEHAARLETAPEITIRVEKPVSRLQLVLSLGGELDEVHSCWIEDLACDDEVIRFSIPTCVWEELRFNVGYWWNVWVPDENVSRVVDRLPTSSVLVRHLTIPRVEGSQLRYSGNGDLPIIDLGTSKQMGWQLQAEVPSRPEVQTATSITPGRRSFGTENQSAVNVDHGEDDVASGLRQRADSILARLKRVFGRGETKGPRAHASNVEDGYLDRVIVVSGWLHLTGWVMFVGGPPGRVELRTLDGHCVSARPVHRPDLALAYPEQTSAADAGFEVKVKLERVRLGEGYEFELIAYGLDETCATIRVSVLDANSLKQPTQGGPFWFGKSERVVIQ